ncbi:MAG: selenocysteine-specific translation elongation factor [Acidobacteria bacterium]|nr:MAG: selenocysteine-specific translation elongation factor [Acidobacteriota bacterium]
MKNLIVGTAGHIDHGKSALVRALTGTDPDRLEEEKRRGITIDLGFAHLDLDSDIRVGFVDVPGHERFVKNMLAGVGGIDLVMLVVAADESIKPQTREHFDICRLLNIRNGLVVITKSDLVDRDVLDLVRLEVQELVKGSFLENAPVIAASAKTGEGLDELRNALRHVGEKILSRPLTLPFRLPIDRAFVMKGFGTVVTGTLIAGTIRKDDEAEIFPEGRRARVRGIQVHNAPAESAVAGQRTALNLAGVETSEIERGMVLAAPGLFQATSRLDCSLTLLPSARPLKNRARVHFHSGTAETVAEVILLNSKDLAPGMQGYVQLRLAHPGLFLQGDRYIVRQFSPVVTIGGGVVLDNLPGRHRLLDPAVTEFLSATEKGSEEERLELLVREAGEAAIGMLTARMGMSETALEQLGRALQAKKRLVVLGQPAGVFIHAEHFLQLAGEVVRQLAGFHGSNPLVSGIAKEDLRGRVRDRQKRAPSATVFSAVLRQLEKAGKIETSGETVRQAGRVIELDSQEAAARDQIVQAFATAGLAVPAASDVLAGLQIDRARAQKILQMLLKEKVLVKVAEDLIFHSDALGRLKELLARQKAKSGRINVGVFKELTGLTRKYAIPLLEYLDRERVTRRQGDERIIL